MGHLSRRTAMRIGGMGLTSVFAQSLMTNLVGQAYAAPLSKPRLVIYMTGNALESRFLSRTTVTSPTNFKLMESFEPFESLTSNLLFVENLRDGHYGDGHGMYYSALTSAKTGGDPADGVPGGPSIDYFIANKLNFTEKFPVLGLGMLNEGKLPNRQASGSGQIVTGQYDPVMAYDRIFGSTTGGGGNSDAELAALKRRVARKTMILDRVIGDISKLRTRLAAPEREKLQQYLSSLETFEKRFADSTKMADQNAAAACVAGRGKPMAPSRNDDLDYVVTSHFDVVAQAFACGLSRSASLIISPGGHQQGYKASQTPGLVTDIPTHHAACHGFWEEVKFIYNYHATKIANFYKALQKIPEGTGTVADNTTVVWLSDAGGEHHFGLGNIPMIVLAPRNGPLNTATYLRLPKDKYSLAKFWVSIAHSMGVKVDTFGDGLDPTGGPIPEMMRA
jgi:Protein of unknown function (DUF1552)